MRVRVGRGVRVLGAACDQEGRSSSKRAAQETKLPNGMRLRKRASYGNASPRLASHARRPELRGENRGILAQPGLLAGTVVTTSPTSHCLHGSTPPAPGTVHGHHQP